MSTSLFSLEGKTAIVTGGSRGIGYAIARAYIDCGARVIITARNQDQLNEAVRQLGANAIALRCDNAIPEEIAATATAAWKIAPIDILVNNAGVSGFFKRAEFVTVEEFDFTVDVNMRGMYLWSIEIAKRMTEAQMPGSIISVSSMLGVLPGERLGVYSATKAAVHQLMRTMAIEWAERGIRVNAIAPGYVDTDFTAELLSSRWREKILGPIPMQRTAQPEEIVGAAIYLASAASSYVTGTVMLVDGGRTIV